VALCLGAATNFLADFCTNAAKYEFEPLVASITTVLQNLYQCAYTGVFVKYSRNQSSNLGVDDHWSLLCFCFSDRGSFSSELSAMLLGIWSTSFFSLEVGVAVNQTLSM